MHLKTKLSQGALYSRTSLNWGGGEKIPKNLISLISLGLPSLYDPSLDSSLAIQSLVIQLVTIKITIAIAFHVCFC